MVDELHRKIPAFNKVNRTRCFLHVLNLVAKSLLKQFELPTKKAEDLSDEEKAALGDLVELASGLAEEEGIAQLEAEQDINSDDVPDEDEIEDWVDEIEDLTDAEKVKLQEEVKPIIRVLVKASNLAQNEPLVKP